MAVTSRAERKRRRCDVLERLSLGWGVGAVTDYLVANYEITRRSANLDIQWASNQLLKAWMMLKHSHGRLVVVFYSTCRSKIRTSSTVRRHFGMLETLLRDSLKDSIIPTAKRTWENHRSV